MADAGERLFGPMESGVQLAHARGERRFAFVEPRDLAGRVCLLSGFLLAELRVAPNRHPVVDVVGEELEPFAEAALVEQLSLSVKEFLNLVQQEDALDALLLAHSLINGHCGCREGSWGRCRSSCRLP